MLALMYGRRVSQPSSTLLGAAAAIAAVAFLVFAGAAANEVVYVVDHPHAYGPAKVIAIACGGGALLSAAVGLIAGALLRANN